jgi:hypothetical protein
LPIPSPGTTAIRFFIFVASLQTAYTYSFPAIMLSPDAMGSARESASPSGSISSPIDDLFS